MMRRAIFMAILGLMTGGSAWAMVPSPPLDDNGNASFVHQVVPKLLGRKAKGTEEVNLLADLADLHGREALVRMLIEQEAFVSHWKATLTDHLQTQREHSRAQSPACFEDASAANEIGFWESGGGETDEGHLAAFVRDNPIQAGYPQAFNMVDLIQSSIHLDNLMPVYRANLYPLGNKRGSYGGMLTAAEIAEGVGIAFDEVYLNRNMECMSCHRGTYSTTGIGVRTHPLYETLDLAMYDHTGLGEIDIIENQTYQGSCAGCHGVSAEGTGVGEDKIPGIRDWSSANLTAVLQNPPQGMPEFPTLLASPDEIDALAEALNGAFGQAKIQETAAKHYGAFRGDLFAIDDSNTENVDEGDPSLGWGPWGMNTECASIVNDPFLGEIPAFFAGHSSDYASMVDVDDKLHQGHEMLKVSGGDLQALDDAKSVPGGAAFAYMMAAKITGNIWEQLMGEPLTIVNKYARNNLQRDMHRYLTEDVFIANDWSLNEVIVAILETRFFNRQAPVSSSSEGPYVLQAIFDPFVPADQDCLVNRDPSGDQEITTLTSSPLRGGITHGDTFTSGEDCAYNGQGELVHRYAPRLLLNSVSAALDWPAPRIFPGASSYPDMTLNKAIGQYISDFDKGDRDVGFQALLNWDGEFGTCQTPANIATADGQDWIDRLHEQIDSFNKNNPAQPLTLGELVLTVKDWLLQEPVFGGYEANDDGLFVVDSLTNLDAGNDGTLQAADSYAVLNDMEKDSTEAQLVEQLFHAMSLDTVIDSESVSEETIRELCGVYLKSPQFMLAGVVRNDTFMAPRFRVCNDHQPCSYQQMCDVYAQAANELGFPTQCNSNSVSQPLGEVLTTKSTSQDEQKIDTGFIAVKTR